MSLTIVTSRNPQRPVALFDTAIWVPAKRFPRYEVSSCGEVRVTSSQRPIAPQWNVAEGCPARGRYLRVRLAAAHVKTTTGRRWVFLHALVLESFKGKRPTRKHEGAHLDGNVTNNHAKNLVWSTRKKNEHHKRSVGTHPKGPPCPKLTDAVRERVYNRIADGETNTQIATALRLHRKTIAKLRAAPHYPFEPVSRYAT